MPSIFRANPLIVPAGIKPGFNASHPASRGLVAGAGVSAFANNGNMINLLTGQIGTITGTPTRVIKGTIGPSTNFPNTATVQTQFSGLSTAALPAGLTQAGIVIFDSVASAFQTIIDSAPTGTLNLLGLSSAGVVGQYSNSQIDTTFVPVVGVPYFIAATFKNSNNTCYFAITSLLTGKVFTTSIGTVVTATTPTATAVLGGSSASFPLIASLARAMYSRTVLSPAELFAWANDPWSFWVTPAPIRLVAAASGAVSVSLTGVNATAAAGTPTVTGIGNVTLTGVNATAATGTATVSGKANFTLTGVSATTAVNVPTITAAANVTPTGVVGTTAVNIPTVTGLANVTLSGVNATGQAGDVTVSVGGAINVTLTGVAATAAVGTPTVTGFTNVTLTGIAATAQIGTLTASAAANASVTGVAATSAVNTPTVTGLANVTLSGVLATVAAGNITVSVPTAISVTLTGASATASAGNLTVSTGAVVGGGSGKVRDLYTPYRLKRKKRKDEDEQDQLIGEASQPTVRPKAAIYKGPPLSVASLPVPPAEVVSAIISRAKDADNIKRQQDEDDEEAAILLLMS